MAIDVGLSVFERLIDEGFNRGNLDALDEFVAIDGIEHQVGARSGRDGLKALISGLRTAFPDLHLAILDTATSGDLVWARIRSTGTNTGSFRGRPATGRAMEIDVIDIVRVADGQITEHWGVADRLSMLDQTGLPMEAMTGRAVG